jgi:hypothetical protein
LRGLCGLRVLLRVLGYLPLLLSHGASQPSRKTRDVMAGFDQFDPASLWRLRVVASRCPFPLSPFLAYARGFQIH